MPLTEHTDYPIGQDWVERESGRNLQFLVEGENYDTLDQAIRAQARLEGRKRPAPPTPKKKRDVYG